MTGRQLIGVFIAVGQLLVMTSAAPPIDPFTEHMPEPVNSTLTETQDNTTVNSTLTKTQDNTTEDVPLESSGNFNIALVNCACNTLDCSNCSWRTNLLPRTTSPMAILQLYNSSDETADYLRKYFCKLTKLNTMLRENMYDWRNSYKRCNVGRPPKLNPKIAELKKDVLCWQYTVLTAYYHELKRQSQSGYEDVSETHLQSVLNQIRLSTKAMQRYKLGLDMPCPVYSAENYIQVYASLEAYHYGHNVLLCVLLSLTFDTHDLQNEVAKELAKIDVTMATCNDM